MQDPISRALLVVRPPSAYIDHSSEATLAHPWIAAVINLPFSWDRVNEVHATTQPLVLRVSYPRPLSEYAGQTLELRMRWLDLLKPNADPEFEASHFNLPVREEYQFAAVQPGRYELSIFAPGAARSPATTVDVKPGMQPIAVHLRVASTIQAHIELPKFESSDDLPMIAIQALRPDLWSGAIAVPIAKLFQNGKEVETVTSTFHAQLRIVNFHDVPPGKYQLRVLGAKEFAEQRPQGLMNEAGKPANAAWDGAEVDVEVGATPPATLDIGEIELKKVTLPAPRR